MILIVIIPFCLVVALVNSLASVIAFAPNPGSPPTKQSPLPKPAKSSRVVWHNLFPPNEALEHDETSDPADGKDVFLQAIL